MEEQTKEVLALAWSLFNRPFMGSASQDAGLSRREFHCP
jgi:hypothetical protein